MKNSAYSNTYMEAETDSPTNQAAMAFKKIQRNGNGNNSVVINENG